VTDHQEEQTLEATESQEMPRIAKHIPASEMAVHRSPDFKTVYANNTKFSVTPFDFSFIFGELGESTDNLVFIEQKVKVTIPPVHAKLFLMVFAQNLSNFEAQFGEIKIPEGFFGMEQTVSTPEPPKSK
jgi:hypothetical protein